MGTPPQTYPAPEPITASASYGRVWDATVDVLTGSSTPIKTIDRASGVILTDLMRISDEQGERYADCGKGGVGTRWVADRVSYNVRVTGDSARGAVRVVALFSMAARVGLFECVSRGVLEREMAATITAAAQRPR